MGYQVKRCLVVLTSPTCQLAECDWVWKWCRAMLFCRLKINCMFSRLSLSTAKEFDRDRPPISSRFQNPLGYFAPSTPIRCLTESFLIDHLFLMTLVMELRHK
ncbi:hypothetical protein YC2023_010300 [Brassica napus]